MLKLIIAAILGAAGGFGIAWLIIRKLPQEKIREINYERLNAEKQMFEKRKYEEEQEIRSIIDKRIEAYKDYEDTRRDCDEMNRRISLLTTQKDILSNDVVHLVNQKNDLSDSIEQAKKDAETTAKAFLKQQMALVQEQLDHALEQVAQKYQDDENLYRETYLSTIKEYTEQFQTSINTIMQARDLAQQELLALQNAVNVAVEAAKRDEQKRQEKNFYRLVLPESDLNEIAQLRAVEPFLRDKEALNKVIWKVYYEKPYTDLIGRVVGNKIKTGIYKITNIENQMSYVGQAVNIAERWKQHIKRGVGAETPTRNKLYPAMLSFGVENFTFEILEECERDKLDIQEDYWQDFFHAKDFGYSIK